MEILIDLNFIVYDEETKCVGLARIGSKTQQIVYATMKELMLTDFGKPLHSLVIPGQTHFIEEDVLKMYALTTDNEEIKEDEIEKEMKNKMEWNGTDFNGIWTLDSSDNLDEYLLSENWSIVMRKAAEKANITQQIIQNEDILRIKVFSKNGNYSYTLNVNGDNVEYQDLNQDICQSIAKWSDDKKCIMETISKKSKVDGTIKEYTCVRQLDESNANRMTLQYINDQGVSVTRYFVKR